MRAFIAALALGCSNPVEPPLDGGQPTAGGSWVSGARLPGGPRQEVGVAVVGGEVFVIGGLDSAGAATDSLEIYDPAADRFRRGASLPQPIHHANVAAAGDDIYVVGFYGNGFEAVGDVLVYSASQDRWTTRSPMPPGTQRAAGAAVLLGGRIVVVGGARGGATDEVSSYDFEADSWTQLPPLPTKREHLVAGVIAETILVAGGRSGSHTARLDAFEQGRWVERAPMPTSRAGSGAAVFGGRFYVFGGEGERAPADGVFDQVESYELESNTWMSHSSMASPRHGIGAAAVGDQIWIPGGADVAGFAAVDVNEAFEPAR
ncbi:MAG: galactose oxidase [Deltaproteobacteria bacterium]|nr:galactose oxidase [Deltaproteobacteria bacterium]